MKSESPGNNTSAEVTNISQHGLWIYYREREFFVPFEQFPWFRKASIETIQHIEVRAPDHFHWPDLDIDLHVEILTTPEKFTLISKQS